METESVNRKESNSPSEHIPVLAWKLAEQITIPRDGIVVDATVGHGGHSHLFGSKLGPDGKVIGLDVDKKCIDRAHSILSSLECKVILIRENFGKIAEVLRSEGLKKADFLLADLGFCSGQMADPKRGLSFQENMPLDMRLDERLKKTAADIIRSADEKSLADLIFRYGEDRAARRIARFIVQQRSSRPITTTSQLAAVICRAFNLPATGIKGKIHPATRTFQALRIAVNDELGNLERMLSAAPEFLKKDAKIAIISFHSLEDRIVKNNFRKNAAEDIYEILTKKPVIPSADEVEANPRARSAKLRIAKRR